MTEAPKVKTPVSPAKGAVIGGVLTALGAIVVAQHAFEEVESSETLTLLIVGVGLVVGAVIGGLLARRAARPK